MISSKSWGVDLSLGRHYGSLMRSSGRLKRVETVKVYARKRRVVLRREDGELKVAERSLVVKKACADCRATSTPLWRRGPSGPRTLCNACGIRYRRGLHPGCGQSTESSLSSSSSSSSSTTAEGLRYEELKQRQKERQMKMLVLLGWDKKKKDLSKEHPIGIGIKSSVAAVSGRKEAEEAALLLLSLSSGILVH